jgi:hypothetical protein
MEWYLDLATFAGIVILSVPVWHLNRNRKILQRIRDADRAGADDADFRSRVRRIAEEKQGEKVGEWRWWQEACLWVGYGLVFGSAFGRLVLPS